MINSPNNTPQQPQVQTQAPKKATYAPSYNAVQINLDTPTLNAPQPGYYYDHPKADGQPYYPPVNNPTPGQAPEAPKAPETPAVPEPAVEQKPTAEQTPAPAQTDAPKEEQPAQDSTAAVNAMVAGLSDPDPDKQALAMNEIAEKGLKDEGAIVPLVQEEVFNKLMNIMDVDSSKLAGPTDQQIQLRAKVAENDAAIEKAEKEGKDPKSVQVPNQLTPDEEKLALSITPLEQAERNKEYALFATALLQKTYGDEIEKRTGNVVPLTDLPAAAMVVDTLKNNPNPAIRTASIDALRFIQRPEYNQDLNKIFTIAQSDADDNVAAAAKDALDSLNKPADAQQAQPAEQAAAQPAEAQPAAEQPAQPAPAEAQPAQAEQPAQPAAEQPAEQPKA